VTESANKFSQGCAIPPLGNVKFSVKHYAMKTYGGAGIYIHVFLTSALDGGKWPVSRTDRSSIISKS
jgi:hypothetical protein